MKLVITIGCLFFTVSLSESLAVSIDGAGAVASDSTQNNPVVMGPVADPNMHYGGPDINFHLESGLFIGRSHIGGEMFLLQDYSSLYGNFFAGMVSSGSHNADRGSAWVSGVGIGREVHFRDQLEYPNYNRVDFYFRAGPGLGFAGTGVLLGIGGDADFHLGFHSHALLGAQLNFSDRTAFYAQGGGRLMYFPSLNRVELFSTPMISIGFRFTTGSAPDPPVRY